jgi:hypothetical protein
MYVTPQQLAESIKTHIRQRVTEGVIPSTVKSFAELHDYCDANVLGDTEALFEQIVTESSSDKEHDRKLATLSAITDPAMEIVDAWIKVGGARQVTMAGYVVVNGKPLAAGVVCRCHDAVHTCPMHGRIER